MYRSLWGRHNYCQWQLEDDSLIHFHASTGSLYKILGDIHKLYTDFHLGRGKEATPVVSHGSHPFERTFFQSS